MFTIGVGKAGLLRIPASPELALDFLPVVARTIQNYGVEVNGCATTGQLDGYRNAVSPYGGTLAGKWPLRVNPDDVTGVCSKIPPTIAGTVWIGNTNRCWEPRWLRRPHMPDGSPWHRAERWNRPKRWRRCCSAGIRAWSPTGGNGGWPHGWPPTTPFLSLKLSLRQRLQPR
jgi:hypothetical protein